jgi:hypothetical protein
MHALADVRVTHHSLLASGLLEQLLKKIFVNDRKPRHAYLLEVPDWNLERIREASAAFRRQAP